MSARSRVIEPQVALDVVDVLVVDDYTDTRVLYTEALREAGMRTAAATGGEEAVELALRYSPRIILMDLSMPGVDGWEATRRIRAAAADRAPYVIAVTAVDGIEGRALALEAGCDGFVGKPCTPHVLVSVVEAFLGDPSRQPK